MNVKFLESHSYYPESPIQGENKENEWLICSEYDFFSHSLPIHEFQLEPEEVLHVIAIAQDMHFDEKNTYADIETLCQEFDRLGNYLWSSPYSYYCSDNFIPTDIPWKRDGSGS